MQPLNDTCTHAAAQQVNDGSDATVRVLGKCLQVAGNATGNGTLVGIATCSGGSGQLWQRQTSGRPGDELDVQPTLVTHQRQRAIPRLLPIAAWRPIGIGEGRRGGP